MNIVFDNNTDILNHMALVEQKKDDHSVQVHYFNLISLHNFINDPVQPRDAFSFCFSPEFNMLKSVEWFRHGARTKDKFVLHPEDFLKNLNSNHDKDFSYFFKNTCEQELLFMKEGSHPQAFEKFTKNYQNEVTNRLCINSLIQNQEYQKHLNLEKDSISSCHILELKMLYSALKVSLEHIEQKEPVKSVEIHFEHEPKKTGEKPILHHFLFRLEDKSEIVFVDMPIQYYLSNMLSKNAHTPHELCVLTIENTCTAWKKFDHDILEDNYELFSTMALEQKLSQELGDSEKSIKLKKI